METRSQKIIQMLNTPKYESTKGLQADFKSKALLAFRENDKQIVPRKKKVKILSQTVLHVIDENISSKIENGTKTNKSYENNMDLCVPDFTTVSSSGTSKRLLVNTPLDSTAVNSLLPVKQMLVVNVAEQIPISPELPIVEKIVKKEEKVKMLVANVAEQIPLSPELPIVEEIVKKEEKVKMLPQINLSPDSPSDIFADSGSEYIPTDESIVSDTSDEDILSEKKNKAKIGKRNDNNYALMPITENDKQIEENGTETNKSYENNMNLCVPDSTTVSSTFQLKKLLANVPDSTTDFSPSFKMQKSTIKIVSSTKDSNGKRIRNKAHACYYCQKIVQNSARHLEIVHGNEMDIAKILAMTKNSKQRRDSFMNMARVGDFYHNTEVVLTKIGELILVRRPTEEELKFINFNDYGPCPHCLGFMLKKHLWHHIKTACTSESKMTNNSRHVVAESNAILNATFGSDFSSDFLNNISSKIRDDEVGNYLKEDHLIMKFGAMQFEKYGVTQCELIRQSMRQLSRFTLKLRDIENNSKFLSDYLVPEKFDIIVQATKLLCKSHQNSVKRPEFDIPSLALKIGYALKKCAAIKRGICLRAGNIAGNETLQNFLHLMELEWSARISSNALATMYNRKINATQMLPLTSDLMKLSQFINSGMKKVREALSISSSFEKWTQLAVLTLSKIILFNKRRSGEASRMTLKDYSSRPMWSQQCTEELKQSLSSFEKKLANQLAVVEIIGKRGRKVPVLLTKDTKESIDLLVKTRVEVNISQANPYVFARSGNSNLNIRGHDCLRKTCSEACLQEAQNITSTKLRKYIATVCQVFNLSENEYDWLARHLGHDIRVHREFYRLHESAVELTKVSRLLIAVDKGEVNKFKDKKLEEINLEDLPLLEEESDNEEELNDNEELKEVNKHVETNQNKIGPEVVSFPLVAPNEARRKTSTQKRPWSSEEKEAVLKYFNNSIKRSSVPGKTDCLSCKENYPVLNSRNWTDIKFCVKNHLDKIKRIKK